MKEEFEYNNRQIIPRWLSYTKYNLIIPEKDNDYSSNSFEDKNFRVTEANWISYKSTLYAIELVASAFLLNKMNNKNVKNALSFINKQKKFFSANPFVKELIDLSLNYDKIKNNVCSEKDFILNFNINANISRLRKKLILSPKDPISWVDMAYNYTLKGLNNKAEKCILIALSLNNSNTFILRSISRFFLHINDPKKAIVVLRNSPIINNDPFLVSAEISICEAFKMNSKFIKSGKNLIENKDFNEYYLNEICATLATLEYNSGNIKGGKRLLSRALHMPNENTLAQAQFLKTNFDGDFDPNRFNVPCKFEAEAWMYYKDMKYKEAKDQARKWFDFQPFSSMPVLLASYIDAVIFSRHKEAVKLIDIALQSSPADPYLLNNKAFSLAKLNETKRANQVISKISNSGLHSTQKATIQATKGLILIRSGKIKLGELLYLKTIDYFNKVDDQRRYARACYFLGKEMLKYNKNKAEIFIKKAYSLSKKIELNDISFVLKNDNETKKLLKK